MAAMTYKAWREGLADYYCVNYGIGRMKGVETVLATIDGAESLFRDLFAEARDTEKRARQHGASFDIYSKADVVIDWRI